MAKGRIEQEIALKVTGTKEAKEAEKLVDKLDGEKVTATVAVDDRASAQIKAIDKLIEGLSDEDKAIVLKAQSAQAQREINKLTAMIGKAKDAETIQLRVETLGNARARLDAIGDQIRELDGEKIDIDVEASGLDDITDKLDALPGQLGAVVTAVRGMGTAGGLGALAAGGVALANSLADASLEAEVLARLTGDSIQNASRLQAVWKTTGADAADLADVVLQMNGVLADTPELAAQIGVNLGDGATIGERFVQIVDLVQRGLIDSATQSKIFGEEGVRQVARLTSSYDDLNAALGDVADQQVFTPQERADLERFAQSMNDLKVAAADVGAELGERVLPVLNALFDAIEEAKGAVEWLDEKVPEGAKEAGISIGDIFSTPGEIIDQFKRNAKVLLGMGEDINATFDEFGGGDFPDQVDASTDAIRRNILALKDWAEGQVETEDKIRANIEAIHDWDVAQQEMADDAAQAMGETQTALDAMASVFNDMARREGALQGAFALGNAPLEALEAVVDVNEAIRDLGEFIEDEGVPNIFDPNDIDAQPFLTKIGSLRQPIQRAVTDAFATGGPAAATATADAYVTQIVKSMDGKLTSDQVRTLLGLDDLTATLKIAVDQASLAAATQMLEILTGLQGETPWTAEVQLALAAGDITPDAARILIAARLEELGIDVPTALEEPSEESRTAAKASADRWAADHPVDMKAAVGDPDLASLIDARNTGQNWAQEHPISFPSTVAPPRLRPSSFGLVYDQGGVVGPVGGIAGERGPEILDGRYLTVGPTYVPPGTRVTSRRRTARIISHGGRGLRRYDNGGVVAGPSTLNIHIRAGVVGNQFDVVRAVRRANLLGLRLYGTR